jgi:uncharacterized delta-60 repeat protein
MRPGRSRSTAGRRSQVKCSSRALAAIVVLAGLGVTRAEGAAPPGQWWNASYSQRLNVTVTGRGAAAPAQYSVLVSIDHARMVSAGQSLATGDDVRVAYWTGGGWVELDRRRDDQSTWNDAATHRTDIWFRTQNAIGVYATDDNYYIYYGNAAAGAPPTNWANVFLFYDDFNSAGLDTTTRWTACTGTCTQSGGGTLDLGSNTRLWAQATFSFGGDTRWESRLRLLAPAATAYNYWGASDGAGYPNPYLTDWITFWVQPGPVRQWLNTANNGTQGNTSPSPAITTDTNHHVYAFDRVGTTGVRFFQDDTQVGYRNANIPDANLRVAVWNDTGTANGIRMDWVRVRKHVTPEPEANARRESTTIGGSCMVTTDIGGGTDAARSMALQGDGKIVVGGDGYVSWATDFALARYNADFRLDTAFGAAGIATTNVDYDDEAWGVAIQPDGKIVLGGHDRIGVAWGDDDFAVVRYNADGTLDAATFNSAGGFGYQPNRPGMVTTQVGTSWDLGRPTVLQSDGKIVVAGAIDVGGQYDFGVARYNPDGSLDTAGFGGGTGKVITPGGSGDDYGNALVVKADPGGYILLAGASFNANWDFALVRYNLNGTLDGSFGSGGKVISNLRGGLDWGAAAVVQPDGKIVVAGGSSNGSNTDFAVVRYNANGSLDTTFGTGGMVFTPIGPGDDDATGVALQPDGKIVVVGGAQNGGDLDFAVVRYNANGSLDTSFGFGGKVTTPIGGGNDVANTVVLQADGRIVVAGESYNSVSLDSDFGMVRYNADGTVDNTCGQVFYSVGTNAGNLATGSPSLTLTSGTATLSAAQTNDVGVGDVIDYGTGQVFISSVISPTEFRVQTATGNLPVDFSGPVSSIKRAFNTISSAVTGSSNASHLNTSDLVALEKGLTWVCYDDGPFAVSATTTISGYTTSATHFITLTVAGDWQVATGQSQRHRGVAGTGTRLERTGSGAITFLVVSLPYTRVEWLELDGKDVSTTGGIELDTAADHSLVRNVIVHHLDGAPGDELNTSTTSAARTRSSPTARSTWAARLRRRTASRPTPVPAPRPASTTSSR